MCGPTPPAVLLVSDGSGIGCTKCCGSGSEFRMGSSIVGGGRTLRTTSGFWKKRFLFMSDLVQVSQLLLCGAVLVHDLVEYG